MNEAWSIHGVRVPVELVRLVGLTPEQFAIEVSPSEEFSPAHPKEWLKFVLTELCERSRFHSVFPEMNMAEAKRVWLAMEENFFGRYRMFVRVWAEWSSSGIWAPPYPGSRGVGPMLDYAEFDLPPDLVARFTAWQGQYWEAQPWIDDDTFDYPAHHFAGVELAKELKKWVGESVYVECDELQELLCDGSTVDCRPRLGIASANPAESSTTAPGSIT